MDPIDVSGRSPCTIENFPWKFKDSSSAPAGSFVMCAFFAFSWSREALFLVISFGIGADMSPYELLPSGYFSA